MRSRWGLLVGLCLLCTGCFWHLHELTESLQTRHVQSCLVSQGFPYPFIFVRIITVTGGASLETCLELERTLGFK
jgi:hypothetical protein